MGSVNSKWEGAFHEACQYPAQPHTSPSGTPCCNGESTPRATMSNDGCSGAATRDLHPARRARNPFSPLCIGCG
eukprot:1232982-Prymnesium_polylepis.1